MSVEITPDLFWMALYIIGGALTLIGVLVSGIIVYLVKEQNKVRTKGHDNNKELIKLSGRVTLLEMDKERVVEHLNQRLDTMEFMLKQVISMFEESKR